MFTQKRLVFFIKSCTLKQIRGGFFTKLGLLHRCLNKIVFVKNPPKSNKNLEKLNMRFYLLNFCRFFYAILEEFSQKQFWCSSDAVT